MSHSRLQLTLGLCAVIWITGPTVAALLPNDLEEITPHEMQAHIDFLASDLLEGRNAGTAGAELAARYVASEFQQLGLLKIGDSWLMEFELGRASGKLAASISVDGARHQGPSLMEVPSNSATGLVKGLLAPDDAESLEGKIALTANVTRLRDRKARVKELAARGAIAVVLLSEDPWIGQSRDRRSGMRERPSPTRGETASEVATGANVDLEEIEEQVRQQLSDMGIDPENVQIVTSIGAPGESLEIGDAQVVMGTLSGGELEFTRSGSNTDLPVVRVCSTLGERLQAAARKEQPVTIEVSRSGSKKTTNVLGLLPGTDPDLADEYVIVGAHYDHVGVSSRGSVYNGADDNASGTAGVLEIAEAFATAEVPPRRSVIFAAWGAEEKGLVGSRAFVREELVPLEKIVAYINLDMIGRNAPREISATCASDTLKGWVDELAERHGFDAEQGAGFFMNMSDSGPFVAEKIPTIFFNTGMHEDLHQPTDTADKIDPDKAARAARLARDVTFRAADGEIVPVFTKPDSGGGGGGIRVVTSGSGGGRRLGVVPGRSKGEGLEVRRIIADSLAEKAGIQKGDRILRIGEKTLTKRSDLTSALKAVKAGEDFEIEILRAAEDGTTEKLVLKGSFEK